MKIIVKRQDEVDITVECPFSIGNIVGVIDYNYAFFQWFITVNPILRESCPEQYNVQHSYVSYGDNLEWKIRKVVPDIKRNELCVLLTTRCGKTMWIQVKISLDIYDKKFKILPPLPFEVIDTSRKSIEEIEIEDMELSLNNNIKK